VPTDYKSERPRPWAGTGAARARGARGKKTRQRRRAGQARPPRLSSAGHAMPCHASPCPCHACMLCLAASRLRRPPVSGFRCAARGERIRYWRSNDMMVPTPGRSAGWSGHFYRRMQQHLKTAGPAAYAHGCRLPCTVGTPDINGWTTTPTRFLLSANFYHALRSFFYGRSISLPCLGRKRAER